MNEQQLEARGNLLVQVNRLPEDYTAEVNGLVDSHRGAMEQVRNDHRLTETARQERMLELRERHRTELNDAIAGMREAMAIDVAALERVINRPRPKGTTEQELLREQRIANVRAELEDEMANRKPSVAMYEEVLERGDDIEIELFEKMAPRRLSSPEDHRLSYGLRQAIGEQQKARMDPKRRAATDLLERLEQERQEIERANAMRFGVYTAFPEYKPE